MLIGAAALALASSPLLAQTNKPGPSATPPAAAAPKPATTGAATAPVTTKVNLNTATPAELEKLPKISPVQSKAIMEARAKSKFKNWDDFVARKLLPADSAAAIKDVVTF
jgi:DNA uptake protein ComE-like DNA-binding protein